MARYAKIKDGRVENVIEAASADIWPGVTLVPATDETCIGDTWDGTAFARPTPVVRVPSEITMRQARLALLAAGKLASVSPAIAALPSPAREAAEIEWEYSNTVQRRNGFVEQLGPALGLSDVEIDALFVAAAGL